MKIILAAITLLFLSSAANATIVNLAPSTQTVTFTGTGANDTGAGTSTISWGACTFDGKQTTCIVSGAYTGIGDGGTYQFVLTYPGDGPTTLTGVASPPGSNFVYFTLSAGSLEFTLTPTNGQPVRFYDFVNLNLQYSPDTATCTGVSECGVGAVGLSIGGTITGPLGGTFDAAPVINVDGVVTATDYGGFHSIAPATFIEIYGLNLATTDPIVWGNSFHSGNAPKALGGTTAKVGGVDAYVELAGPHQVNLLVPSEVAPGEQPVVVKTFGGASLETTVTVNAVAPGVLAPAVFKLPAGQYVFAVFPDNKTYVLPPNIAPGIATRPAKPGDVIILYGNGFGPVTPDQPAGTLVEQTNSMPGFEAAFAGVKAKVQFAGLVKTYTGLYQFNIVVPKVSASNAVPLTFKLNGIAGTQKLIIPVGK